MPGVEFARNMKDTDGRCHGVYGGRSELLLNLGLKSSAASNKHLENYKSLQNVPHILEPFDEAIQSKVGIKKCVFLQILLIKRSSKLTYIYTTISIWSYCILHRML